MIEVYHNSEFLLCSIGVTLEALKKGYFEFVATVETDDLEEAYRDTNSIDKPWHLNANVKVIRRENRSTSVGDLFVRNKIYYIVNSLGFRELTQEEECGLTFYLRTNTEGSTVESQEVSSKADISRQLAKELDVPCTDLSLSQGNLTEAFEDGSLKNIGTPPAVIEHLEAFKEKGYTIVIQFTENDKLFGEPLFFKTPKHVSSFMWDNPKMKMVWLKNI
jgi:hypothetical protein